MLNRFIDINSKQLLKLLKTEIKRLTAFISRLDQESAKIFQDDLATCKSLFERGSSFEGAGLITPQTVAANIILCETKINSHALQIKIDQIEGDYKKQLSDELKTVLEQIYGSLRRLINYFYNYLHSTECVWLERKVNEYLDLINNYLAYEYPDFAVKSLKELAESLTVLESSLDKTAINFSKKIETKLTFNPKLNVIKLNILELAALRSDAETFQKIFKKIGLQSRKKPEVLANEKSESRYNLLQLAVYNPSSKASFKIIKWLVSDEVGAKDTFYSNTTECAIDFAIRYQRHFLIDNLKKVSPNGTKSDQARIVLANSIRNEKSQEYIRIKEQGNHLKTLVHLRHYNLSEKKITLKNKDVYTIKDIQETIVFPESHSIHRLILECQGCEYLNVVELSNLRDFLFQVTERVDSTKEITSLKEIENQLVEELSKLLSIDPPNLLAVQNKCKNYLTYIYMQAVACDDPTVNLDEVKTLLTLRNELVKFSTLYLSCKPDATVSEIMDMCCRFKRDPGLVTLFEKLSNLTDSSLKRGLINIFIDLNKINHQLQNLCGWDLQKSSAIQINNRKVLANNIKTFLNQNQHLSSVIKFNIDFYDIQLNLYAVSIEHLSDITTTLRYINTMMDLCQSHSPLPELQKQISQSESRAQVLDIKNEVEKLESLSGKLQGIGRKYNIYKMKENEQVLKADVTQTIKDTVSLIKGAKQTLLKKQSKQDELEEIKEKLNEQCKRVAKIITPFESDQDDRISKLQANIINLADFLIQFYKNPELVTKENLEKGNLISSEDLLKHYQMDKLRKLSQQLKESNTSNDYHKAFTELIALRKKISTKIKNDKLQMEKITQCVALYLPMINEELDVCNGLIAELDEKDQKSFSAKIEKAKSEWSVPSANKTGNVFTHMSLFPLSPDKLSTFPNDLLILTKIPELLEKMHKITREIKSQVNKKRSAEIKDLKDEITEIAQKIESHLEFLNAEQAESAKAFKQKLLAFLDETKSLTNLVTKHEFDEFKSKAEGFIRQGLATLTDLEEILREKIDSCEAKICELGILSIEATSIESAQNLEKEYRYTPSGMITNQDFYNHYESNHLTKMFERLSVKSPVAYQKQLISLQQYLASISNKVQEDLAAVRDIQHGVKELCQNINANLEEFRILTSQLDGWVGKRMEKYFGNITHEYKYILADYWNRTLSIPKKITIKPIESTDLKNFPKNYQDVFQQQLTFLFQETDENILRAKKEIKEKEAEQKIQDKRAEAYKLYQFLREQVDSSEFNTICYTIPRYELSKPKKGCQSLDKIHTYRDQAELLKNRIYTANIISSLTFMQSLDTEYQEFMTNAKSDLETQTLDHLKQQLIKDLAKLIGLDASSSIDDISNKLNAMDYPFDLKRTSDQTQQLYVEALLHQKNILVQFMNVAKESSIQPPESLDQHLLTAIALWKAHGQPLNDDNVRTNALDFNLGKQENFTQLNEAIKNFNTIHQSLLDLNLKIDEFALFSNYSIEKTYTCLVLVQKESSNPFYILRQPVDLLKQYDEIMASIQKAKDDILSIQSYEKAEEETAHAFDLMISLSKENKIMPEEHVILFDGCVDKIITQNISPRDYPTDCFKQLVEAINRLDKENDIEKILFSTIKLINHVVQKDSAYHILNELPKVIESQHRLKKLGDTTPPKKIVIEKKELANYQKDLDKRIQKKVAELEKEKTQEQKKAEKTQADKIKTKIKAINKKIESLNEILNDVANNTLNANELVEELGLLSPLYPSNKPLQVATLNSKVNVDLEKLDQDLNEVTQFASDYKKKILDDNERLRLEIVDLFKRIDVVAGMLNQHASSSTESLNELLRAYYLFSSNFNHNKPHLFLKIKSIAERTLTRFNEKLDGILALKDKDIEKEVAHVREIKDKIRNYFVKDYNEDMAEILKLPELLKSWELVKQARDSNNADAYQNAYTEFKTRENHYAEEANKIIDYINNNYFLICDKSEKYSKQFALIISLKLQCETLLKEIKDPTTRHSLQTGLINIIDSTKNYIKFTEEGGATKISIEPKSYDDIKNLPNRYSMALKKLESVRKDLESYQKQILSIQKRREKIEQDEAQAWQEKISQLLESNHELLKKMQKKVPELTLLKTQVESDQGKEALDLVDQINQQEEMIKTASQNENPVFALEQSLWVLQQLEIDVNTFQSQVKQKQEEAKRQMEEQQQRIQAEEAKRVAEEQAKLKAEEAKRVAEEQAKFEEERRLKAEADAIRMKEEAKLRAEVEAKLKEEEAIRQLAEQAKLEEETKRQAEEAAKREAEEAKFKEEEAKRVAEEQAKIEEEKRLKAEADAIRMKEEAKLRAEAEAKFKEEEAKRKEQEAEVKRQAKEKEAEEKRRAKERKQLEKREAEAMRKIAEQKKQEEAARRKAEEQRKKEEAQKLAEESARQLAEQQKQAEEAKRLAEEAERQAEDARKLAEQRRQAEDAKRQCRDDIKSIQQEIDGHYKELRSEEQQKFLQTNNKTLEKIKNLPNLFDQHMAYQNFKNILLLRQDINTLHHYVTQYLKNNHTTLQDKKELSHWQQELQEINGIIQTAKLASNSFNLSDELKNLQVAQAMLLPFKAEIGFFELNNLKAKASKPKTPPPVKQPIEPVVQPVKREAAKKPIKKQRHFDAPFTQFAQNSERNPRPELKLEDDTTKKTPKVSNVRRYEEAKEDAPQIPKQIDRSKHAKAKVVKEEQIKPNDDWKFWLKVSKWGGDTQPENKPQPTRTSTKSLIKQINRKTGNKD